VQVCDLSRFSDLTRNQVPFRQPIQNAGQCRSLMSKATMEFGNFRRPGIGKHCQDVGFALGQSLFTQFIEIKANSMRCPVNRMNKAQTHL